MFLKTELWGSWKIYAGANNSPAQADSSISAEYPMELGSLDFLYCAISFGTNFGIKARPMFGMEFYICYEIHLGGFHDINSPMRIYEYSGI